MDREHRVTIERALHDQSVLSGRLEDLTCLGDRHLRELVHHLRGKVRWVAHHGEQAVKEMSCIDRYNA